MAASQKNPNKFGFSFDLVNFSLCGKLLPFENTQINLVFCSLIRNFLTLRNENLFSFPSLNRNFALSLHTSSNTWVTMCHFVLVIHHPSLQAECGVAIVRIVTSQHSKPFGAATNTKKIFRPSTGREIRGVFFYDNPPPLIKPYHLFCK